jgi:hypothetical protein
MTLAPRGITGGVCRGVYPVLLIEGTQKSLPLRGIAVDWQGRVCISTHRLARMIAPRQNA